MAKSPSTGPSTAARSATKTAPTTAAPTTVPNTAAPNKTKVQTPPAFTFIDLFAGIGGIRMGFEAAGGKCVFTSEWNRFAQATYQANFKDEHPIAGDITKVATADIPDHDVLVAGFPCQPFSIAGVSKKASMGRSHGFKDKTQGTLFFDVARIIKDKRPKAFLLENVKNLVSHDKGNTFKIICETLVQELGYTISYKVIDGRHFTPQHRERIYIIGWRSDVGFDIANVPLPKPTKTLKTILHPQNGTEKIRNCPYLSGPLGTVLPKYTLTPNLWTYLQNYAAKHKAAGNGFGFGLVGPDSVTRTLSARYYKDGSEILIDQGNGAIPRRLTPRECARLMGYPDSYKIVVSDTQAYKQFGNSVVVPVLCTLATHMLPFILQVPADTKIQRSTKRKTTSKTTVQSLMKRSIQNTSADATPSKRSTKRKTLPNKAND